MYISTHANIHTHICTQFTLVHMNTPILNSQAHMHVHISTNKHNLYVFLNAQKMHNTNSQNNALKCTETYPNTCIDPHTYTHAQTHKYIYHSSVNASTHTQISSLICSAIYCVYKFLNVIKFQLSRLSS